MKQANDFEQIIDRAIASDRGSLPQQSPQPPADLLSRVVSTPPIPSNASLTATGISVALKIGIVATLAAGSVTWYALSRSSQPAETTRIAAPEQLRTPATDSLRKPQDSARIAVRKSSAKPHIVEPANQAAPFIPTEHDLPTPSGTLETHVKDSTSVHVKVK